MSDSGDILSPKYAPEIIAPAAIGAGIPSPDATPISATPTVPAVVHEEPVARDTTEQRITVATRKILGDSTFRP